MTWLNLYVRKLRKLLDGTELDTRKDQKAALKIKREIYEDLLVIQKLYDEDTRHSLNKERQKRWDDEVAGQLQDLSKYSYILK